MFLWDRRTNVVSKLLWADHHLDLLATPLVSVRPQMVDFGSEQGLSNFETAGIAGYVEDFKRAKTPLWAKRCRLWMGTNQQSGLTC